MISGKNLIPNNKSVKMRPLRNKPDQSSHNNMHYRQVGYFLPVFFYKLLNLINVQAFLKEILRIHSCTQKIRYYRKDCINIFYSPSIISVTDTLFKIAKIIIFQHNKPIYLCVHDTNSHKYISICQISFNLNGLYLTSLSKTSTPSICLTFFITMFVTGKIKIS